MTRLDAEEKDILESVERGEWRSARRGNREAKSLDWLCQGDIPKGSASEHSYLYEGPRSYSEARP
jgi:hypothetical protein